MSYVHFEKPHYAFYSKRMTEQFGERWLHRKCNVDGKWRSYSILVEVVYESQDKIDMSFPRSYILDSAYEDLTFIGVTQKVFY